MNYLQLALLAGGKCVLVCEMRAGSEYIKCPSSHKKMTARVGTTLPQHTFGSSTHSAT